MMAQCEYYPNSKSLILPKGQNKTFKKAEQGALGCERVADEAEATAAARDAKRPYHYKNHVSTIGYLYETAAVFQHERTL